MTGQDDRQVLREWAESFCETEHDGETSFGERVQLAWAVSRVLDQLAEAEGTLAWLRERLDQLQQQQTPTPPWPAHPVRLRTGSAPGADGAGMWLGMPGGRLYLPDDAIITIEYPKTDPEEPA